MEANIFISGNNQNISPQNQDNFLNNASNNQKEYSSFAKAGFPVISNNNKNLNVFLPSIDNRYFANHIQEVLNPIFDETGNYSFYNINNQLDVSNDTEQITDYDYKRVQPNDRIFANNKFLNNNNNNFTNDNNNFDNRSNNLNNAKKHVNNNQMNPMMMGFGEAEKRRFSINYSSNDMKRIHCNNSAMENLDMDNAEFLDFNNLDNPVNNFNSHAGQKTKEKYYNQMNNFNVNNINYNNNNEDYIMNKQVGNRWADQNFVYRAEGQNNMMFQKEFMLPNNINNNSGRQIYNSVNNFPGSNMYDGVNLNVNQGKINNKNTMGFGNNASVNINNNNYYSKQMMQNKMNNSINSPKDNINNMRFIANKRGNAKLLMESTETNNPNSLNYISNKNFNKHYGANVNNNFNNLQSTSPINNTIDHDTKINMKLSKNISNYTELSNEELAKNALVISKDQCGCRFIQKKISENSDFSNNFLFPAVIYVYIFNFEITAIN